MCLKLVLTIEYLHHRRPYITSGELEHLMGNATFAALTWRDSLGCFSAVYSFTQRGYQLPHAMWQSIMANLRVFRGVLNLGALAATYVRAVTSWPVQAAGAWNER